MLLLKTVIKKFRSSSSFNVASYILLLFILTRLVLVFAGLISRNIFSDTYNNWYEWKYTKVQWLDLWSVWDSAWYLNVAEKGYSPTPADLPKVCCGQANTAFFPLYPMSVRILGNLTGSFYNSALLISNISLIFSGIFLYKRVLLDYKKDVAKDSVLFMFLFPTGFVLSGIFSESMFLLLTILSFYFAKKNKWFFSGISGFLLSLVRPTGVFCLLPIAYIYLKQNRFKLNINVLSLLFYPAGLLLFCVYLYKLTGNPFAFSHSEWGARLSNPFTVLYELLTVSDATLVLGLFTILELLLLLYTYLKSLHIEYLMLSLIVVLLPLINGIQIAIGIPRMSSAVFPLFLALALTSKNPGVKKILAVVLISVQVTFMMFWSVGV